MDHVADLAVQLQELQQSKQELDVRIKKLEQQLLSTEALAQQKLLLSNQGGQKSHRVITTEIKRNHVWDQEVLTEILDGLHAEDHPAFMSQQTTIKVDYRAFESFAMANPEDALVQRLHAAHSIKLGPFKIKEINTDKLKENL